MNDVGDNGSKRFEEINQLQKGGHFGWPDAWGGSGGNGGIRPLYSYQSGGCAITGGMFYSSSTLNLPQNYKGKYFFSDYCGDWIKMLTPGSNSVATFWTGAGSVDLQLGPDGAIYVLRRNGGKVEKFMPKSGVSENPGDNSNNSGGSGTGGTIAASITSPSGNTTYTAGQTINFSASGSLADSSYKWTVCLHHHDPGSSEHAHPVTTHTGKSGSLVIPDRGEWSSYVWYRFILATSFVNCDPSNKNNNTYVDLLPKKSTITLAVLPAGLKLELEGENKTAPITQQTVAGLKREISAPASQSFNGKTYTFVRWSDNGSRTHDITVPTTNTTYTAIYTDGITIPELPTTPTVIKTGTLSAFGDKERISDLNPSQTYTITVKGTFIYGSYPRTRVADAQWDDALESTNNFKLKANNIIINGTQPDADDREGTFSSDHTYSFSAKPDSNGVIELSIFDSNYTDNSGSMKYEIATTNSGTDNTTGDRQQTILQFDLLLDGIGKAGDAVNPGEAGGGNSNLVHFQRPIKVELVNAANETRSLNGLVIYDTQKGSFVGKVMFDDQTEGFANFTSGDYAVKVKFTQSLNTTVPPGLQTITKGQTKVFPQFRLVNGDITNDGQVNIADYNLLLLCYSDLEEADPTCTASNKIQADITDDGKVNIADLILLLREMSVREE